MSKLQYLIREDLQYQIPDKLQYPIHDTEKKRYNTRNDCRLAISPGGVYIPPGAGQPRDDTFLRSSDLAPLAPNHACELNTRYGRGFSPTRSLPLSGWNGGLQDFR